jgi:hypothetical protein
MKLNQILSSQATIEKLRILSFEMNIYLVDVELEEYRGLVRDDKDNPQRFHSVTQIKELFSECTVEKAELVHESPYDEMIGNPPRATNQMVLPIHFSSNRA